MLAWLFGKRVSHPQVPVPDWRALRKGSNFLKSELRVLHSRFCDSCQDDGYLSKARFMFMPEMAYSPFAALAFHFEAHNSPVPECIDFPGFVNLLSHLSPKAPALDKVDYLCRVLKVGSVPELGSPPSLYLHKHDVAAILYQLCLGNVAPPVLEKIMDSVWDNITAAAPEARDKGISKSELAALLSSLDILTYLTVPF